LERIKNSNPSFQVPFDFYSLTPNHFRENDSIHILQISHTYSPSNFINTFIPEISWNPWIFPRVTNRDVWRKRTHRFFPEIHVGENVEPLESVWNDWVFDLYVDVFSLAIEIVEKESDSLWEKQRFSNVCGITLFKISVDWLDKVAFLNALTAIRPDLDSDVIEKLKKKKKFQ